MQKFDKSRLPSRHTTEGPERAPHRAFYYAMGLTEEEIHRPIVGVASCWNEAAPCNIALMRQAQSAKRGVKDAGGTPREFCTITVTDGIAMGHEGMKSSLVSREVIADFDRTDDARPLLRRSGRRRGLRQERTRHDDGDAAPERSVGISLWRLDHAGKIPWQGCDHRRCVRGGWPVFRGAISDAELHELECVACPGAGACGGQFTANTMACVSEAIGLALPYSAGPPAEVISRDDFALKSGEAVMQPARAQYPPARHLHAKGLRERRDDRCGDRRFDQCGAASSRHGE